MGADKVLILLIYSDKLHLSVLDLTQIENAMAEDEANGLVYWSKLFAATSWEGIYMIEKPITEESTITQYTLSEVDQLRLKCEAIEDYYKCQNDFHNYYRNKIDEKNEQLITKYKQIATHNYQLLEKDEQIIKYYKLLVEKMNEKIAEKDKITADLKKELEEKNK